MNQPFPPPDPSSAVPQPVDLHATTQAPARKRSKTPLAIGALVVVALVGAGAFAVASMSDDDDGASSPQAAVERLFDAVDDQDVLGVLESLAPGEREAFTDSITGIVDQLERLGVVADDTDLSSFPGVDLEVEDVTYATEEIGDGVATVTVTGGSINGSYDLGDLPIGDTIVDTVLGGERPEGTDSSDADDSDLGGSTHITTVERDGGWYVSLWYSIAEQARVEAGLDAPAFGQGVEPQGADSPEGAVEAFVRAALDLDLEGLVALLPPDEMAAVHDYAPLFLPDAQAALDDVDVTGSLDDFSASSDQDGDEAVVTIDSLSASLSAQGEEASVTYDGDCAVVVVPDQPEQKACRSDTSASDMLDRFGLGGLIDTDTKPAVRAVEVDGKWYLSPTRSLLGVTEDALAAVDADALHDFLERITDNPERFLQGLVGAAMTNGGLGAGSGIFTPPASTVPPSLPPASTTTTTRPTTTTAPATTTTAPATTTTATTIPTTTAASTDSTTPSSPDSSTEDSTTSSSTA